MGCPRLAYNPPSELLVDVRSYGFLADLSDAFDVLLFISQNWKRLELPGIIVGVPNIVCHNNSTRAPHFYRVASHPWHLPVPFDIFTSASVFSAMRKLSLACSCCATTMDPMSECFRVDTGHQHGLQRHPCSWEGLPSDTKYSPALESAPR